MAIDSAASRDALWIQFTQDATDGGALAPPLDPRIGLTLCGHILGVDRVLGNQSKVCYGFLAKDGDDFVALIRGTADTLEWCEDSEFLLTDHGGGAKVELGFFGLYSRMTYVPLGGTEHPLGQGIAGAIGSGSIKVVGHSLGAALATYLTLDLAIAFGDRVSGCFLASPRPGDGAFAALFHSVVKNYVAYAFALDLVPRVPMGFSFSPLPNTIEIDPDNGGARIKFGIWCNHHAIDYAALLDYSTADWQHIPTPNAACILGKHP